MIDPGSGSLRPNVSVAINGGVITQIAPDIPAAPGLTVVDASGKFLIPGLWDMHVHLSGLERSFRLLLAHGITGVREMNSGVAPREYAPWRRHPLAPRLVVSGLIDGPRMTPGPGRIAVNNAEEARLAVRTLAAQGAEFIKVYNNISRDAYFALADECRRIGIPFAGHVPEEVSPAEAAMAGQLSQEHLMNVLLASSSEETDLRAQRVAGMNDTTLTPEELARRLAFPEPEGLFDTYDPRKAVALFQNFADYGIWHTPTLVLFRSFAEPTSAVLDSPAMRGLTPAQVAPWTSRARVLSDRYRQLVKVMHAAGVPLLAGTDAGPSSGIPLGESLHRELELLVAAGLTPAEALATATRNPAFYFGTLTSLGSLETGKVADIVMLDANPLEDIRNTRRIRAVIQRGTYYSREALDKLLQEAQER